jgi:hypothetical protein
MVCYKNPECGIRIVLLHASQNRQNSTRIFRFHVITTVTGHILRTSEKKIPGTETCTLPSDVTSTHDAPKCIGDFARR